ncbi:hypothetical protein [Bradyrhizobium sp. SZCCHNS3052]|uniref:hypothetical protein n=1 Tax=Bradyrhizobium sp. SZCCHNS3052 TaxID=3057321 RepID=UPI002915EFA8|nr:hypothetical protein [Bradyrhizobium sp. SZCCHNS3052]
MMIVMMMVVVVVAVMMVTVVTVVMVTVMARHVRRTPQSCAPLRMSRSNAARLTRVRMMRAICCLLRGCFAQGLWNASASDCRAA